MVNKKLIGVMDNYNAVGFLLMVKKYHQIKSKMKMITIQMNAMKMTTIHLITMKMRTIKLKN